MSKALQIKFVPKKKDKLGSFSIGENVGIKSAYKETFTIRPFEGIHFKSGERILNNVTLTGNFPRGFHPLKTFIGERTFTSRGVKKVALAKRESVRVYH